MKLKIKYLRYIFFVFLTCYFNNTFCQQNIKITNILNKKEYLLSSNTSIIKVYLKNKDTSLIDRITSVDSVGLNLRINNRILIDQIAKIELIKYNVKGIEDVILTTNLVYYTVMTTLTAAAIHSSYNNVQGSGIGAFIMTKSAPIWAMLIPFIFNVIIASYKPKIVLNQIKTLRFENTK